MGTCQTCGVLVADALIHAMWHAAQSQATTTNGDPDAL